MSFAVELIELAPVFLKRIYEILTGRISAIVAARLLAKPNLLVCYKDIELRVPGHADSPNRKYNIVVGVESKNRDTETCLKLYGSVKENMNS